MKTGLRCFRLLPMAALVLFTCAATARPLLVPPQNLALPPLPGLPPDDYFKPTYNSVAIDGGTLLVGASRPINEQNECVSGVYIFERNAAGRWALCRCAHRTMVRRPEDRWLSRHHKVSERRRDQGVRTRRDGLGAVGNHPDPVRPGRAYRRRLYLRATATERPLRSLRVRAAVPGVPQGEWRLDAGRDHRWRNDAIATHADMNDGRALIVHRPRDGSYHPNAGRDFRVFASRLDSHRQHSAAASARSVPLQLGLAAEPRSGVTRSTSTTDISTVTQAVPGCRRAG